MSPHFKHDRINHPDLERYLTEHTSPEPELLQKLFRETHVKMHHPRRSSDHLIGQWLAMVCRMVRPEKVLEIGTFTGYGALVMAATLPEGGELHTIEINDELESFIRKWIQLTGLTNRVHLHIGDALKIIPEMDLVFDLVFIDGEKDQYLEYYEAVLPKIRPGGFIVADNALWSGKVLGDKVPENDHFTRGIMCFNDHVQADPRVDNLLLPVFDGMMICRKKSEVL